MKSLHKKKKSIANYKFVEDLNYKNISHHNIIL